MFIDLVDRMDGEQLLEMHEYLHAEGCHDCLGTGAQLGILVEESTNTVLGIGIGPDCECCAGLGFHYMQSIS